MDSLFKRILAYLIDMLLVSFVLSSIISSSVNFQLDNFNNYYDQSNQLKKLYNEQSKNNLKTCNDLSKAIEKKEITQEDYITQYQNLVKEKENLSDTEFEEKCLLIVNDYNTKKISYNEYVKEFNRLSKKIEINSTFSNVVMIVICILYFVFFQGFTGGQTLGKKITHIKVVSTTSKKLSYKQLFIRTIFLYDIIYTILKNIIVLVIPLDYFVLPYDIVYLLNMLLTLVIITTIISNKDRKGIHDIIAHTRVMMIDFKGNEIKDKPFIKKKNDK